VLSGKGRAIVEGKEVKLNEGNLLLIEAGETHEIINNGDKPLETLNVYAPIEY
jgi:mannose-6-phosphate isomerase-like protein (cupin superfamily)